MKIDMVHNSNDNDSSNDLDNQAIGPMEIGYMLFTAPFILFCIGIAIMVAFNVR